MNDNDRNNKTELPSTSLQSTETQNPWEEEKKEYERLIKKYERRDANQREAIKKLHKKVDKLNSNSKVKKSANPALKKPGEFDIRDMFVQSKHKLEFGDIGGLDDSIMKNLKEFTLTVRYGPLYEAFASKAPHGLLLYGIPGTGKTFMTRVMSNQLNCPLVMIKGSDIFRKYVGESEQKIRGILQESNNYYAQTGQKVILFFDEADQIFVRRGNSNSSRARESVVSEILTYMDGFEEHNGIIYVAATNRVDQMSEASRRAGRFNYPIEVKKPDKAGVADILEKHFLLKESLLPFRQGNQP